MRYITLFAMAVFMSFTAIAYDFPYLVLESADGTAQAVEVEGLSLSIENNQLVLSNPNSNLTLPLSELNKMYFSSTTNSIDSITTNAEIDGPVEVYNLNGIFMGRYSSLDKAMSSLSYGTYLIKSASTTLKIAVK